MSQLVSLSVSQVIKIIRSLVSYSISELIIEPWNQLDS